MSRPEQGLKNFVTQMEKDPSDLFNRLFFAARNGAISYLLLQVDAYFRDQGFAVKSHWSESSFGPPVIKITLLDKKTGEHERSVFLNRDVVGREAETHSACVYSLKQVSAGAYYRSRKPAIAENFDQVLGSEEFKGKMEEWVLGTNYPFDYHSYSSF